MALIIVVLSLVLSILIGTYLSLRELNVDRDITFICAQLIPWEMIRIVLQYKSNNIATNISSGRNSLIRYRNRKFKIVKNMVYKYPSILPSIGTELLKLQIKRRTGIVKPELNIVSASIVNDNNIFTKRTSTMKPTYCLAE